MSVSVYYLPLGSQESHFMTIISPGQGTRWVRAVASFFMAPDGFFLGEAVTTSLSHQLD